MSSIQAVSEPSETDPSLEYVHSKVLSPAVTGKDAIVQSSSPDHWPSLVSSMRNSRWSKPDSEETL